MPDPRDIWKRFRLEHERKADVPGVLHPDVCPKLMIHGVEFAIPPRGVQLCATFTDGVAELSSVDDDFPGAAELLDLAPLSDGEVCETCGQAVGGSLDVDFDEHAKFLCAALTLAAKVLSRQYDFSDGDLARLLTLGEDNSQWVADLVRWAGK